jgi:energy-coupling factor transport system ATP-binding protein
MGANGSGKSTLVRTLGCLLTPSSGFVRVDGMLTSDPSHVTEIRRRIGVVFQNPAWQMTSLTVERELAFGLENVGLPQTLMQARVNEQLRRFDLDTRRYSPPWALSAGEQQRAALAATLILEPACLVLDEATSLLSPPSRRQVMETVNTERSRRLVVLITQFPGEALMADRLVVLHRGELVADGPPREVLQSAAKLEALGVPVPFEMTVGAGA